MMPILPPCDYPASLELDLLSGLVSPYTECVQRRASDLQAMFYDKQAVQQAISSGGDPLIYEFFHNKFITSTSDMAVAVTRIFPGKNRR
jgi:oxalate decarboxylase/phosphoglucose isomerase-like protein (cupin superfamily)